MSTDWNAADTATVLHQLGVSVDEETLRNSQRRLRRANASVAVIGLVGRGKSTFVNQLVGLDLCAVSARPETAAVVGIEHGEPAAHGRTADGELGELPTAPGEFRAAVSREVQNRIVDATYSGDVALPSGLTLIDTPGVGEASMDAEQVIASWAAAGADAAVVVISVPPGAAASDMALLDAARKTFPLGVMTVVKATASSVSSDDLTQVADHLGADRGLAAFVVKTVEANDDTDIAPIRDWLGWVATQHERATAATARSVDQILVEAVEDIVRLQVDRLPALSSVLDQLVHVEPSVAKAIRQRRDVLANVERARADEESRRAAADRARVIDESAHELVRRLPKSSVDPSVHGPLLTELRTLADQGSAVAAAGLRCLWGVDRNSLPRQLQPATLVGALPHSLTVAFCTGATLTPGDMNELAGVVRTQPRLVPALEAAAAATDFTRWDLTDLADVANRTAGLSVFGQVQAAREQTATARMEKAIPRWTGFNDDGYSEVRTLVQHVDDLVADPSTSRATRLTGC